MNREDTIKMARETGALQIGFNKTIMQSEYSMFAHELERFAALVAAAEREACAVMVEKYMKETDNMEARGCLASVAYDIRARGQQ